MICSNCQDDWACAIATWENVIYLICETCALEISRMVQAEKDREVPAGT